MPDCVMTQNKRIFIIGAGRFGTHLAKRLAAFDTEVIVADMNPERVQALAESGLESVELNAEDPEALKEAGVQEADTVVVGIGENMQGSILATLNLKELEIPYIVTRALDEKHAKVLEKLGANSVVLPARDMAYQLAETLRSHFLNDRIPIVGEYQVASVALGGKLSGISIEDAKLPEHYHVNILLLVRESPNGDEETPHTFKEPLPPMVMMEGDTLFVSGTREHINAFESACG